MRKTGKGMLETVRLSDEQQPRSNTPLCLGKYRPRFHKSAQLQQSNDGKYICRYARNTVDKWRQKKRERNGDLPKELLGSFHPCLFLKQRIKKLQEPLTNQTSHHRHASSPTSLPLNHGNGWPN
uniref:Uncharacterized protein n=1 Tax=Arundo donax TaxID=35708 RepID=A0A0A9D8D8_ARUDO